MDRGRARIGHCWGLTRFGQEHNRNKLSDAQCIVGPGSLRFALQSQRGKVMAGSVNKVILVGNLGKDPEVRRMTSGDPVVNLSVATSESWRDKATRREQGKDRVAPGGDLQQEPGRGRREISAQRRQGLSRGLAADPQMDRQGRGGEILHRSGAAEFPRRPWSCWMAAAAKAAAARERVGASEAPASFQRDEMDDEIPF